MALVVLDRDGVINEDSDEFIRSLDDWRPVPGSLEAIARLNQAGFEVVVFTNQSGIARGYFDRDTLAQIHRRMLAEIQALGGRLAGIYICPHGPDDGCSCRKPQPGLLRQIEQELGVDLRGVPVIGDSRRDLEAAAAVGARPILVKTGKGLRTLQEPLPPPAEVYPDLAHAVDRLLAEQR
ncbi:MAG TPA: D-glycero-beta-D-manno-heptose 1,7-bisphosphate 7-phosphatase [Gammaproteobacteria bacterium]|nr:D-glycero-beta-D-manno-heptose 1,7-bisphosphate 7-phosphatase [Gammaproteobacteria bacterium]